MTKQTEDQSFNFHDNAAALIVAAAEKSGLLRNVANALRFNNELPRNGMGCFACAVLEKVAEHFEEECFPAGFDFFGEDIMDYSDEELRPYLEVPFALPLATEEVTARMRALKESQLGIAYGMGVPPKTTTSRP